MEEGTNIVDLQAEKTEAEWQKAIDDFWKKATPKWFEWLEWIFILGVVTFLAENTQNLLLDIVWAVSYFALFSYLQSFFFSFEFHGLPLIKSENYRRSVSLILSAIMILAFWFLLTGLLSKFQGKV